MYCNNILFRLKQTYTNSLRDPVNTEINYYYLIKFYISHNNKYKYDYI